MRTVGMVMVMVWYGKCRFI